MPSIRFDPTALIPGNEPTSAVEWYRDPTGAFSAGIWRGEPGRFDVTYTEDEFCQLLEGVVRLTDAHGTVETYRAGDSFVIPAGFIGVWETVETIRKFWVIHQAAA